MPAGRPSLYKPTYCDLVIETMSTGLSLTAFAGEIGVSRETVNEWRRVHPEFSAAVKIGQAKRALVWEQKLMSAGIGPHVTSTIFALKNIDPDEWRDRHEVAHTHTVKPTEMTDDELARIAAGSRTGIAPAARGSKVAH